MTFQELVTEVANRTQGTKGDPLTAEEVEQIVQAAVDVLDENEKLIEGAFAE